MVRSTRDPQEMGPALESALRGIDATLPLAIQPWTSEMDSALFAARVATVALGVLGLLGAMLAITGIFGMASYVVSRRMRELGIRLALGAGRSQILSASLGRVFRLLAYGSVAGIVLGLMATKVLAFIVYQATPRDPFVLGWRHLHHARAGHDGRVTARAPRSRRRPAHPPSRRVAQPAVFSCQ